MGGGLGKRVDGVFPGRPQSFRHQHRPVDDCSLGRGGMAQDGGTRGGMFPGAMDRCRENQGWTAARRHMPERDGKDQGEDSLKQAGSCWFARPCWLAASGADLYPLGVWIADLMTSFSGVAFLFVLLCFRLHAFYEAAALCSIVLRYARAPIATRVSFFFPFYLFGGVAFSEHHCRFLFVRRVRRTRYVFSFRMEFKENLNASKPSDQSKGLGGNIGCRDKNLYTVLKAYHGLDFIHELM